MNVNKLKGKIAEAGLTQRSISEKLGMSKNTVNSKVNGKIPFNINEVDRFCDLLGIRDNAEKAAIFLTCVSQNSDNRAQEKQNGG